MIRDKIQRLFDPKKYLSNPDGTPKFNKWGCFVPRGGRKPKAKMETPTTPPTGDATSTAAPAQPGTSGAVVPPPEPAAAATAAEFHDVNKALETMPGAEAESQPDADKLAAELKNLGDNPTAETVIGLIQTGLILIGEEEGILSDTEKILIRRPLLRTLEKYDVGKDVLPPEVDLALAVLGVIAFRLQKPKTAKFFAKVRAWVVEKFFASKGKKLARELREEVGPAVNPAAP
jgi:hypothetical protein